MSNPWNTTIAVGDHVSITGLLAKPELNGANAVVEGYDAERERFNVRVQTGTEAVVLALKAVNLSSAGAPPPPPPRPPPDATRSSSSGPDDSGEVVPPAPPPTLNGQPHPEAAEVDANPWVCCSTPEGARYWYNKVSQESTWTDPTANKPPPEAALVGGGDDDLADGWQAAWDPRSEHAYYVNPSTAETTWVKPLRAGAKSASAASLTVDVQGSKPASSRASADEAASPAKVAAATGSAVGQEAAEAMRALKAELQQIYDDAHAEELADRGGGEHGGAQAFQALEACEKMLAAWEVRARSLH